jgi:organic hydroperoxide reductase OsmC/OhrA
VVAARDRGRGRLIAGEEESMSEHTVSVVWERGGADFGYESYSRNHVWEFGSGVVVPVSAAPGFLGGGDRVDPEEAFVAALSSCHMLTFLALAARRRRTVDAYADAAVGVLAENDDGKLAIARVTLRPAIRFAPDLDVTDAEIEKLHHRAHDHCFIANSVRTEVVVEPRAWKTK